MNWMDSFPKAALVPSGTGPSQGAYLRPKQVPKLAGTCLAYQRPKQVPDLAGTC